MTDREIFYSNPGSPVKDILIPIMNDDGSFYLEKRGEENIQEYIDSFAEETCIPLIIERCQMGDTSVLSKRQGVYGDFTEFPKTFRDILQSVIDGRNFFDELPVETKKVFNNSFENWYSRIGDKDWYEIMDKALNPSTDPVGFPVVDEVIKDE